MTKTQKVKRPKNNSENGVKEKVKKSKVLKKAKIIARPYLCDGINRFKPTITLLEQWNNMRKENKLCDGVVVSNDGKQFAVHKMVIYLLGPYFKRSFKNPKKNINSTVDRANVLFDSDITECFIEYAYTGKCRITEDSVKELMSAAYTCGLTGLLRKCCEFLYDNINPYNCIQTFRTIDTYLCPEWRRKIFRYICHHFREIMMASQEFTTLKMNELKEILSNDELNVRNENEVFEAIVKWNQTHSRRRRRCLPCLIHCPRYGFMTNDYFTDEVLGYYHVQNNKNLQEMLSAASAFITERKLAGTNILDIDEPLLARPRIPYSILFVIGGWTSGKPTNMIETYDIKANKWYVHDYPDEQPIAYHSTCVVNNLIYVIGGFNGKRHCNNVRCYNPVTHEWRERSGMFYKRCYLSTCALDGKIYALGGFNGHLRLTHAEMYDPERNQWSLLPDMHVRRSDASAASMNGKVYVAGGYNGHQILRSMEYYDPTTKTWLFVVPMSKLRCGLNLITWNNRIYALGGSNGLARLSDGEYYDGQGWQNINDMHKQRSNASAVLIDDHIYVMGGYDGRRTLDYVECFDPFRNQWSLMQPSMLHRSAASACVVSGLPNAREYSYLRNEVIPDPNFDPFEDVTVEIKKKKIKKEAEKENRQNLESEKD